jgi:hypothetical protein
MAKEYVHDIGLIVGGSVPQPLHFDIAKSKKNRKCYDDVMAHPFAPAVVLMPCGARPMRIGFGKSEADLVETEDGIKCMLNSGSEETFRFVGEVEQMVYQEGKDPRLDEMYCVESDIGFKFKGDFIHSGMPPVTTDGEESKAWSAVNEILGPLLLHPTRTESGFIRVFEELCTVPSLHTITRFHCMILPRTRVEFHVPVKDIGYYTEE